MLSVVDGDVLIMIIVVVMVVVVGVIVGFGGDKVIPFRIGNFEEVGSEIRHDEEPNDTHSGLVQDTPPPMMSRIFPPLLKIVSSFKFNQPA